MLKWYYEAQNVPRKLFPHRYTSSSLAHWYNARWIYAFMLYYAFIMPNCDPCSRNWDNSNIHPGFWSSVWISAGFTMSISQNESSCCHVIDHICALMSSRKGVPNIVACECMLKSTKFCFFLALESFNLSDCTIARVSSLLSTCTYDKVA